MITPDEFHKGIKKGKEITPIDILEKTGMAMSTQEIADKLSEELPEPVTYACVKQKMIRLEKKELVERSKVKGLNYWLKASKK